MVNQKPLIVKFSIKKKPIEESKKLTKEIKKAPEETNQPTKEINLMKKKKKTVNKGVKDGPGEKSIRKSSRKTGR